MNNLLFKFSIPAMVAMVVNALYSVVGMIFVGRGVGALAITALSIILPVQLIMMALGVMVGIGVSSVTGIWIFKEVKTFDKLMLESVNIVV